MLVKIMIIRND